MLVSDVRHRRAQSGERIPNRKYIQVKAFEGTFAFDPLRVFQNLNATIGPVDLDAPGFRIDQPSQLSAVVDP